MVRVSKCFCKKEECGSSDLFKTRYDMIRGDMDRKGPVRSGIKGHETRDRDPGIGDASARLDTMARLRVVFPAGC